MRIVCPSPQLMSKWGRIQNSKMSESEAMCSPIVWMRYWETVLLVLISVQWFSTLKSFYKAPNAGTLSQFNEIRISASRMTRHWVFSKSQKILMGSQSWGTFNSLKTLPALTVWSFYIWQQSSGWDQPGRSRDIPGLSSTGAPWSPLCTLREKPVLVELPLPKATTKGL